MASMSYLGSSSNLPKNGLVGSANAKASATPRRYETCLAGGIFLISERGRIQFLRTRGRTEAGPREAVRIFRNFA